MPLCCRACPVRWRRAAFPSRSSVLPHSTPTAAWRAGSGDGGPRHRFHHLLRPAGTSTSACSSPYGTPLGTAFERRYRLTGRDLGIASHPHPRDYLPALAPFRYLPHRDVPALPPELAQVRVR